MEQTQPVASPGDILATAGLVEAALSRRSSGRCADLLEAAAACEVAFGRRAAEIREEAQARLKLGAPPSMRQLVGISNLEVPMNRMLGWMFDPTSRGAAARKGLTALCALLDFPALATDIQQGRPIVVMTETSPDPEITSRQPDLIIGSTNAVVLIENKVGSPESGPDQYSHYLDVLRRWAGSRESRAYLFAPTERSTPLGWERCVSHRELAEALRPLATDPTMSFWDRVVYALIASDLDPDLRPNRAREIERLIDGGGGLSDVAVATKLSQLLRHPSIDPTNGGY